MQSRILAIMGLTSDEKAIVEKNLPQKECEIMDTDDVRDIIATPVFAAILKMSFLNMEDINMLFEFYTEIVPCSETVIFIGQVEIPNELVNYITVYKDFDELEQNIKYVLLSALRKQKKSENFSATLAKAIKILNLIREHPYITSMELAEELEISQRSVQRYIETLRVAGEWIEYSPEKRGWILPECKSVLKGDFRESH